MKRHVFLIEQLVLDSSENEVNAALTYNPVGFYSNEQDAIDFVQTQGCYNGAECWALMGDEKPKFRYSVLFNADPVKED